jgi:hypothetical protein
MQGVSAGLVSTALDLAVEAVSWAVLGLGR